MDGFQVGAHPLLQEALVRRFLILDTFFWEKISIIVGKRNCFELLEDKMDGTSSLS